MKLVITGGHHSSALPVINELKKRYPDVDLYWIGHRHSLKNDKNDTLEYREITALSIPFYELNTGKIYKTYNPFKVLKVVNGLFQSFKILSKIKPDLIMSFGGYLAVPVVIAGYIMKIPSITHEQTMVTGYANRVISHFAKKILLSWESSQEYYRGKLTVVTGIPLRPSIFTVSSNSFDHGNSLPTILVMGGKSGSHALNQIVLETLPELLSKFNVIHQCGDYSVLSDYEKLAEAYRELKNKLQGKYFVQKFILDDQIGEAYNRADLIVARSGAHTVAEVISLKKRVLFIPITWVSHNEQFINATLVRDIGLGMILEETNLSKNSFLSKIEESLLIDISKVDNSLGNQNLNAAEKIVNEIVHANKT